MSLQSSLASLTLVLAAAVGGPAAPAAAAKIAVLAPRVESCGAFPTEERARAAGDAITDAIAAHVSRRGHYVVTEQQIQALVGIESARQLAGFYASSCSADLAAALGVDLVLTARVTLVGVGLLLVVKRIDTRGEGGRVVDKRLPVAELGPLLDAIPALVGELLVTPPTLTTTTPATTTATTPTATASTASSTPTPAPTAANATTSPPVRVPPSPRSEGGHPDAAALVARLAVAVDEASGAVIAFMADDALHGPLFAGRAGQPLYEARLSGGSQSDGGFDVLFWDPRFREGRRGSVARLGSAGVLTLQCGKATTTFKVLPPARARERLAKATLRKAPWQRALLGVGRDDDLTWYVVDGARDAPADALDLALYVGRRGHMVAIDAEGARVDGDFVFAGEGVKLRLPPAEPDASGRPRPGTFTLGAASTAVTPVDVFMAASEVYSVVRPWGDLPLGTPCDAPAPTAVGGTGKDRSPR